MYVFNVFCCLAVALFCSAEVLGGELTAINSSATGYGYEMIMAKLEYLQFKLIEIELTIKEDRETVDQKLIHQETLAGGLLWAINKLQSQTNFLLREMSETIGHNLTVLQTQSNKMISQQTACVNHEEMRKEIQMLGSKVNWTLIKTNGQSDAPEKYIHSCKQEPSMRSGKYLMQSTKNDEPFEGYCEQQEDDFGGGWLVIQYRFNGSVDFSRNWTEYRNGFGSLDGEFWLGLERLHQITSARSHELLVQLKDFSGNYKYARYSDFEIGDESEQYLLKKLNGVFTGTAGDSLAYHKRMAFSTKDRDNDRSQGGSCATSYKGAWWYDSCSYSNLNGPYNNSTEGVNMHWYNFNSSYSGLAYSRMLIREK